MPKSSRLTCFEVLKSSDLESTKLEVGYFPRLNHGATTASLGPAVFGPVQSAPSFLPAFIVIITSGAEATIHALQWLR